MAIFEIMDGDLMTTSAFGYIFASVAVPVGELFRGTKISFVVISNAASLCLKDETGMTHIGFLTAQLRNARQSAAYQEICNDCMVFFNTD